MTDSYLNKIKSLLTPFQFDGLKRYGGNHDGGYVLSEDLTNKSNIVYSFGVGPNDYCISFDRHMAELGKTIYLYDGSVNNFWDQRKEFIFKKEFINSKNFASLIKQNNHEQYSNMVLKMDIEGAEYETITNCEDSIFNHFNQFTIEIHDILNSSNVDFSWVKEKSTEDMKIAFLEKINKFYKLVHIHGNNYSEKIDHGICDVLELTYIRNDEFHFDLKISELACPIESLDFSNKPHGNDIKMNWWIKNER